MNILFVCTGNINRSASGESILKTYVRKNNIQNVFADSSGLNEQSKKNRKMNKKAINILKEKELLFDENKRSNFSSQERINWADAIIVMQPSHKKDLIALYGESVSSKIHFAIEFLKESDLKKIPDPNFSKGTEEFYYVIELMEQVVKNFLEEKGYAISN